MDFLIVLSFLMITLLLKINHNYYATKTKNHKYLPDNDEKRSSLMDNNMLFKTFIHMRVVSEKFFEEGIM